MWSVGVDYPRRGDVDVWKRSLEVCLHFHTFISSLDLLFSLFVRVPLIYFSRGVEAPLEPAAR